MRQFDLSIIIPLYNVAPYICETIDSIYEQGIDNYEVIMINDGSTDNTLEVIEQYRENSNFTIIDKPNGGAASARNRGLDIAKGRYITFVDGDDVLEVDSIRKCYDFLENNADADIVQYPILFDWLSETERYGVGHEITKLYTDRAEIMFAIMKEHITTSSCDKFYRREAIGDLRFEEGVVLEDNLFVLDLLATKNNIYKSLDGLYKYRSNPNSVMRKKRSLSFWRDWSNANSRIYLYSVAAGVDKVLVSKLMTVRYKEICKRIWAYNAAERREILRYAEVLNPTKVIKGLPLSASINAWLKMNRNYLKFYIQRPGSNE